MRHLITITMLGAALIVTLALTGCGGASAPQVGEQPGPQPPAAGGPWDSIPAAQPGVQMPTAQPVDINFDASDDKSASAVYRILFRDSVNEQSMGRWVVQNDSGQKFWTLSNTFFSAPKAWVLGQNYWNRESDLVGSNLFAVGDGEDGLALTFMARWRIAPGDHGAAVYYDGQNLQQVVDFTAGQNPSYPGWDKYYFKLPANNLGFPVNGGVAFTFSSDIAVNDWGFGVDNVAVYQTQLGTPIGMVATDGTAVGQVDLDWDHVQVGNLLPDGYDIYRADDYYGTPGTFAFLASTVHPNSFYTDFTGDARQYWYKVVATKVGWPDSPESNTDSGHGTGTWMNTVVDADNIVGQYCSLATLPSGFPAIAYHDNTNGDLRFAYSTMPDGSSGWTDVLVDGNGFTGLYASLAIINGKPAIACYDSASTNLHYSYSSEVDGSSGWSTITVDADPIVGLFCSLKDVNGFPAISYSDSGNITLKYAYSNVLDGSSGWTDLTVDSPFVGNNVTSLAVIAGNPAIAYWDSANGDLEYAYSSTPDGSAGWATTSVDTAGSVGAYASLALINGFPGIAYADDTLGGLKYAYSNMPDGSSGWSSLTVDSGGGSYLFSSLALIYGKPAIAYLESPLGGISDLKYAFSTAPDGSGGWFDEVVESTDTVGTDCSLATVGGRPSIGCRDGVNNDVKFYWYQ